MYVSLLLCEQVSQTLRVWPLPSTCSRRVHNAIEGQDPCKENGVFLFYFALSLSLSTRLFREASWPDQWLPRTERGWKNVPEFPFWISMLLLHIYWSYHQKDSLLFRQLLSSAIIWFFSSSSVFKDLKCCLIMICGWRPRWSPPTSSSSRSIHVDWKLRPWRGTDHKCSQKSIPRNLMEVFNNLHSFGDVSPWKEKVLLCVGH